MQKLKCLIILILLCLLAGCSHADADKPIIGDVGQEDLFVPLNPNIRKPIITEGLTPTSTPTPTIVTPVPGNSYFDSMFDSSDTNSDEINESDGNVTFEFNLDNIEHEAAKKVIIEIYNDNNYSKYEFLSVTAEEDRYYYGEEETRYVVKYNDSDYWIITCNGDKAYATKDEYGIMSELYE